MVRLDHNSQSGYIDPAELGPNEIVDLLTMEGSHEAIPLNEVKAVYFVREFNETFQPVRKAFLSRPRQEGLWVRLLFVDGDRMEGLVPNDLLGLLVRGIHITPPDSHGNAVRLYIPRAALTELRVLGVIGAARHARTGAVAASPQGRLFETGSEE